MQKIYELLLPPFTVASLIWIMVSISSPFKTYNNGNVTWQIFGVLIMLVTFILAVIIFKDSKKHL